MTVAIYHYVKPGKEAWKLFLLSLKARLFENMTSQASVPQTPGCQRGGKSGRRSPLDRGGSHNEPVLHLPQAH